MDTSLNTETATSTFRNGNEVCRPVGRSATEEDNTPWTATRCLRLLRPLESRIEPLEKWAALHKSQIHERSLKRKRVDNSANPGSRLFQGNTAPDPVWIPVKRPKGKNTMYSSKSDLHSKTTTQPGILLPTPFRVRHHSVSAVSTENETSGKHSSVELTEKAAQAVASRRIIAPKSFLVWSGRLTRPIEESGTGSVDEHMRGAELHRGIVLGLHNVLNKTRPSRTSERGCPSLFSMCLRKVPEYIKLEQATHVATDGDDDKNATADIYADLEDLGPTSAGWRPLKEVVRAHGLYIVRDLLRDGTISIDLGAGIVRDIPSFSIDNLCEARILVTAYIIRLRSNTSTMLYQPTHFDEFVGGTLRWDEICPKWWPSILKELFANGSLFSAWLGTRDIGGAARTWVRDLVDPDCRTDVLEFYESATRVICSNPPATRTPCTELSYDTVQAVFPVLTAMAIIGLERTDDDNRRVATSLAIWTTLQTLAVELLTDDPHSRRFDGRARHTRAVVLMTNLVLESVMHPSGEDFVRPEAKQLIRHMAQYCDSQQAICAVGQFLTKLASCCGNQQSQANLESLQNLLGELVKLMQSEAGPGKEFLQQVVIRASADFAASDRSREAIKYAWTVEAAVEEADPLALDELCSAIKPLKRSHSISQEAISELSEPYELDPQSQPVYRVPCEDLIEHPDYQGSPPWDSKPTPLPVGSSPSKQAVIDANPMHVDPEAIPQNAELGTLVDDSGYVSGHAGSIKTPLRSRTSVLPPSYLESPDVLAPSVCEHAGRHSSRSSDHELRDHISRATVKRRMRGARPRATEISESADDSDDELA